MSFLSDVCSRLKNVKRGMLVFFGSASVLLTVSGEGYAQSGKTWSLRACIEHAREHNIQVAYSRVALENTRVELTRGRAQRLPSLDFSSTQGWGHQKKAGAYGDLKSSIAYAGNYSLNGNMVLYQGGKLSRSVQQQELAEEAILQDVMVAQNDIELAVAKAYLQILYANEMLKTDRQTLESSEAQLICAREFYNVGSMNASDLAQMEAQYSSDRYRVVQAENDLALSKLQLKQLLELEPEESFEVFFSGIGRKRCNCCYPPVRRCLSGSVGTDAGDEK